MARGVLLHGEAMPSQAWQDDCSCVCRFEACQHIVLKYIPLGAIGKSQLHASSCSWQLCPAMQDCCSAHCGRCSAACALWCDAGS
jgi:hypothetical protein